MPFRPPAARLSMIDMWKDAERVLIEPNLVIAFAGVGVLNFMSNSSARLLTGGRIHGSAIAIVLGLALAYLGGILTCGKKGIADIEALSGIGLMGGAMLRDYAIVATAFEVDVV